MDPYLKQKVARLLVFLLIGCSPTLGGPHAAPGGLARLPPGHPSTLYVTDAQVPGSVASVPVAASGSTQPRTRIHGRRAGLAFNYFASADGASGRLWTTNCLGLEGTHGPVVAFELGADGNVPPVVSIGGPATGLSACQTGVAVDRLGDVVVADITNTPRFPGGHVAVFEAGRQGDIAPRRRIAGASANFHSPAGIAIGSNGEIYVADSCQGYLCAGDVQVFAPNADGNAASVRRIAGDATGLSTPEGVALDSAGRLYVANMGVNTITVYAPEASGNAAPIRTIGGSKTHLDLPTGLALDDLGYLYVGTGDGLEMPGTHIAVLVFAPAAKGNATPHAAITLRAGGLAIPSGVALQ